MSSFRWMTRLARDERGGEVLEYALIAGLIVVAARVEHRERPVSPVGQHRQDDQ